MQRSLLYQYTETENNKNNKNTRKRETPEKKATTGPLWVNPQDILPCVHPTNIIYFAALPSGCVSFESELANAVTKGQRFTTADDRERPRLLFLSFPSAFFAMCITLTSKHDRTNYRRCVVVNERMTAPTILEENSRKQENIWKTEPPGETKKKLFSFILAWTSYLWSLQARSFFPASLIGPTRTFCSPPPPQDFRTHHAPNNLTRPNDTF